MANERFGILSFTLRETEANTKFCYNKTFVTYLQPIEIVNLTAGTWHRPISDQWKRRLTLDARMANERLIALCFKGNVKISINVNAIASYYAQRKH